MPRQRLFDERLWPIQLGIWGLALYVVALLEQLPRDGTDRSTDRWISTTVVAVCIAAVVSFTVPWISPRRLRHGLILALCLSLAINLTLAVGLSYIRLVAPRPQVDSIPRDDPPSEPEPTLAEFYPLAMDGDDRPVQDEQRAVSTGEPQLQVRDLVRMTSVSLDEPVPLRVDAVPELPRRPMTAVIPRTELIESAPRRADLQGTLSRQDLSAQPNLGDAGDGPLELSNEVIDLTPSAADLSQDRATLADSARELPPDPLASAVRPDASRDSARRPLDLTRSVPSDASADLALPTVEKISRAESSSEFLRPSAASPVDPHRQLDRPAQNGARPADTSYATRQQASPYERPDPTREEWTPRTRLSPTVPAPEAFRRSESSGLAEVSSRPDSNMSPRLIGSDAEEMVSPVNRPVQATRAPRRTLTGSQRATVVQVPIPRRVSPRTSESNSVRPAEMSTAANDTRRGRLNLPEVLKQPGGAPVELGSRRPSSSTSVERAGSRQAPQLTQPAAEQLTTSRDAGEGFSPALPTDVQHPKLAAPAENRAEPTATSLARNRPQDKQVSSLAAHDIRSTGDAKVADNHPSERLLRDSIGSVVRVRARGASGPLMTDSVAGNSAARDAAGRRRAAIELVPKVSTDVMMSPGAVMSLPSGIGDQAKPAAGDAISRRSAGALSVDVAARAGRGGLSSDISTDVGLLNRQAQPESDQIVDSVGRFIRRPIGGPLSIDSHVPIPARAYQTRLNRQGQQPAGGNGRPSPRTEDAIEFGLLYLSEHQRPDGSWSFAEAGDRSQESPVSIQSDSAATGLALLTFLGAGYHHRSEKFGDIVREGLEYLVDNQRRDGDLFVRAGDDSNNAAWLYSHGIATIALCEAYGMTQDPELRGPSQMAVDFIVTAQHPERGGWRYQPGVGSDTSVAGWMVIALRSAELANLTVPVEVWNGVGVWLEMAKVSDEHPEQYRYNPLAPNTVARGHGRRASKTMTAVGLLMRMYTGWRRDNVQLKAGADYLLKNLPEVGSASDPKRDTYYWYYATQVMFHMRGDYWERWNNQLHEMLTSTQIQIGSLAGSWDPVRPIRDRWAPHAGRLYVTTLNLLSLEVHYRHLPIYEDTAR